MVPKSKVAGLIWNFGVPALPVRETVCAGKLPPKVTVIVAVRTPSPTLGVKTTEIAQLFATASVAPQVLVCEKSPGLAPEMAMLPNPTSASPQLVTSTVTGVLATPCYRMSGKLTPLGSIVGTAVPRLGTILVAKPMSKKELNATGVVWNAPIVVGNKGFVIPPK